MKNSQDIPWKRLFAEAVAVVVSILLAFAIDAWWEDRKQIRDEEVILTNLHSVLSDYRQYFRNNMEYSVALKQSVSKLLDAAADPESILSDAELDKLISDLTWYIPSTVTPELTAALSSESIEKLSNQQLIYRLGVLNGNFADLDDSVAMHQEFFLMQLMPFLQKSANLRQINNAVESVPGSESLEYPATHFAIEDRVSHRELLNDREFQNILVRREWRLIDIIEFRTSDRVDGSDIDSDIDQLLQTLDQELAK
jgi:hypothetical protein